MTDPLSINVPLANVETTLPLLPEADFEFQITESTVDANKDNNGLNWNLTLSLVNPTTDVTGTREVKPNHKVFHVNALQARPDSKDVEAYLRSLGETVDAIFGTDKSNRPALTKELVDSAVGKIVIAQLIIDEWKGQKNNKVRKLKARA